jgi:hypothetical protein
MIKGYLYIFIDIILVLLFSVFIIKVSYTQPVFENKTRLYKKSLPSRSVIPGGILDLDGDLVDDIAILDRGIWLKSFISSGRHFGIKLTDSLRLAQNSEITLAAGDLNNDGTPEIITSGEYSLINVSSFINNKITKKAFQSGIYAQGSNTIDINNDGWLDYFLTNDDGPSRIYLNDKNGNLILTPVIDFMKGDTTDGSGNYGSVWTDVNGDFLPDLSISKCRAYITRADDPRRINRLYINRGNGFFEEKGAEFGLNSGEQSWVTAFGDLDNDGDQDAFVVNHYAPHILLENVGNQKFVPVTKGPAISSFGFQAIMIDLDNDGFLDIVTAGVDGAIIFHNQGNMTFKILRDVLGPNLPRSLTAGDLNDDGFPDIYAHINEPINLPGLKDDELWLNIPNQNHFIKLNLEGNKSNRSAIGAHITLFTPKGVQIRYVKGGESYGIFNSFQQIFGLGTSDKIDSVRVRWPSGITETFTQLKAGNTYFIQEGKCITPHLPVYNDEIIWKGNAVSLVAPTGYTSYLWNNGSTTSRIETNIPAKYFVKMTDSKGCTTISKPINVISGCFSPGTKLINDVREVKICKGTSVEIASVKADKYKWSNGSTDQSMLINKSQTLTLASTDYCNTTLTDTINIKMVEFDWTLKGDSIKKGSTATLKSNLPMTQWFEYPDLINPVFTGPLYKTIPLDSTTKYFAQASEVIDLKTKKVGASAFPVADLYGANTLAGGLVFNVERSCIIKSVLVNSDTKGKRRIIIAHKDGNILFSKDILIDVGTSRIQLDATLQPGIQYKMYTDEDFNMKELGYKSPRLVRTFNNTQYPYLIDNVLTINASTFGAIYYYYFYDWEVHYDHVVCQSELKEVIAYVDKSTSTSEDSDRKSTFKISPSPAFDNITIIFPEKSKIEKINIQDISGKIIKSYPLKESAIDISNFAPGIYFISAYSDNRVITQKFVKI